MSIFIKDFLKKSNNDEQYDEQYYNLESFNGCECYCECEICKEQKYDFINNYKILKIEELKKNKYNFIEKIFYFKNYHIFVFGDIFNKVYFSYSDIIKILKNNEISYEKIYLLLNDKINTKTFIELKNDFKNNFPYVTIYNKFKDSDKFLDIQNLLYIDNIINNNIIFKDFLTYTQNIILPLFKYDIFNTFFKEIETRDKIIKEFLSYEKYIDQQNIKNTNKK